MDRKKILLLKSPFSGIGKHIGDLTREYGEKFELVSLKYFGEIPHPKSAEYRYSRRQFYSPKDFEIERYIKDNKKEVTSMRLSDILKSLKYFDTHFEINGEGLALRPKHPFHDAPYKPEGDEFAIERIASLIDKQVGGILTVWSKNKGGMKYIDAMDKIHNFFNGICEQNSNLFLISDPCETKTSKSSLSKHL